MGSSNKMGENEHFEELTPMYALGSLSEPERSQVEQHLKECDSCRKRFAQEWATVQMLPAAVESVEPSRAAKQKLFERIDADLAQEKPRTPITQRAAPASPRRWFAQPTFAFAILVALALLAIGGWILLQNLQSPDQEAINAIVNNPNAQKVALAGTKDAPNAAAELYMVPGQSQAVLVARGLQPLSSGKGYEFWFFRGGEPQPSNVFTVNADGTTRVLVQANDNVENFKGWGVTIEPIAGVPKPTGAIVLLGGL